MSTKTRHEKEHNKLMKIISFHFPNQYKKIGLWGAGAIFAFLIVYKFTGGSSIHIMDFLRTIMLLFLLLASLSQDKFEDEYTQYIRSQSYVIAFVCAVAYSVVIPLITFILDIAITNIRGEGTIKFHETSAFVVIFMLICFQILFCETLKRYACA